MNNTLNRIALVLLAAGAFTATASAQSSVTLYGRAVGGLQYIDKIDDGRGGTYSAKRAADNQWGTSMLGFKGQEDLGGGLKAYFKLEGGFSTKRGTFGGNALFNRRSFVGLSSDALGSLQFGKNLQIINDVWYLDPTGQQSMGSATLVRERSWQGAKNVVEYSTPNWGGFGATAQVGLGEIAGSMKNDSSAGVSIYYVGEALELRAIYSQIYDANAQFTNAYNQSKEAIVGGTYKVGPAKIFAAYDHISAPDAPLARPSKVKHGWLGVRYDATPVLTL
ncbi:MAG: porin, partial [Solirubrobacteraceae bacterium]|nr:porin [Solirubrobacteraceae bacterium]